MSVVAKALWYIENNFSRCPSLDDIAAASGTTRFHLSHSFRWVTGQPVMAYARGRRLTEAFKMLAGGAPSILAVAIEAGYGSQEAFTRAFCGRFGLTPDAVRRGRTVDATLLVEPISMDSTNTIPLAAPRVADQGALTIVGLGARFRTAEAQGIPALWQRFQDYEGTLGEVPGLWYGVCGDWDESGATFFYMAGVAVTRTEGLPNELSVYRFPAQSYLVFRHDHHISGLRQTTEAIFGRYLPENGYHTAAMGTYFELYDEAFDPISGLGGIELWLPVPKRR